jgi:phosphohistidine phosphatase
MQHHLEGQHMSVYLVQHGKSLPKEIDPEQGLSAEGRSEVERIAAVSRDYGIRVSGIRHSGKKRAMETALIFAEILGLEDRVEAQEGLNPLDDVTTWPQRLQGTHDLMLIGHLPFMERLSAYLITGNADITVFRFQNAGVVCLDKDLPKKQWVVKWALMPHIG